MYKSFLVAVATAMLFGCVSRSMAADGNLSKSTLADMGLSSVQVMSDVQGEEIRGKGFAFVRGYSTAYGPGGGTRQHYAAAGRNYAEGGSHSKFYGSIAHRGGKSFGRRRGFHFGYSRIKVHAAGGAFAASY